MKTPVNRFKQAILNKQVQYGLWVSMGSAYSTEICAGAGFDWLLLDCEHAPNDLQSILMQLQITAAYQDTHPVVRVPVGHGHAGVTLIKQFMDAGATTILVPMVDTAEQAQSLVQAMRYPPQGIRGMGTARAARWGRYTNYTREANEQVCLLVQAETTTASENIDAIAAVDAGRNAGTPLPGARWRVCGSGYRQQFAGATHQRFVPALQKPCLNLSLSTHRSTPHVTHDFQRRADPQSSRLV